MTSFSGLSTEIRCAAGAAKKALSSFQEVVSGWKKKVSTPAVRPYSDRAAPRLAPEEKATRR